VYDYVLSFSDFPPHPWVVISVVSGFAETRVVVEGIVVDEGIVDIVVATFSFCGQPETRPGTVSVVDIAFHHHQHSF